MAIVVDQPRQGGDNLNDGNTTRIFFDHPAIVVEIKGLDESCYHFKKDTHKTYCLKTAKLCVQNYEWYKVSASVHKLFVTVLT